MAAPTGRGFALAVLLVAVGFVLAPLSVTGAASRIGSPLVIGPGLIATVILARLPREAVAQRFLLQAMLLSIGVRLMFLTLIHQSVGPIVFAPDANVYEQVGQELLQSWRGLGPTPDKAAGTQAGYYAINAAMFMVFGRGGGGPVALNILLATWLALPVYYLTLAVVRDNHAVARWATVMALFFPSMILWSVLNIREAPTIFCLVSATCFFARFQKRPRPREIIGGSLALLGLLLMREYLMVIVGLSAGAGVVIGKSKSPLTSLVGGGVLLFGLTFLLQHAGLGGTLAQEPTLERVQYLRQDLALGAASAYGGGADVSTVGGAISFIPVGLTYFLLAPFPWSVTSVLQQVTLPESIAWYALVLCVFRGAWLALKYDPRAYTVLVAVLATVTFSYALVEGNVGTAYRHRAQVLPLFFVLAAVGLRDAWGSWMERRIEARAGKSRAAASLQIPPRGRPVEGGPRRR
jgi:hypothetical protein